MPTTKSIRTAPARDARGRFLPRAVAPAIVVAPVVASAVAPAPALERQVLPACLAPQAPVPRLTRAVLPVGDAGDERRAAFVGEVLATHDRRRRTWLSRETRNMLGSAAIALGAVACSVAWMFHTGALR